MAESQAIDAAGTVAGAAAGSASADTSGEDDAQLFCYRHPNRATLLRCGRCDRPICLKCSVQGPVGFRCRECGTLRNDPLTSFRPQQLVLASLVSLGGGAVAAIVAGQIGFFSIFVSYFAGGLIVEAVRRVVGYKHGPVMIAIIFGGIVGGAALGFLYAYSTLLGYLPAEAGAGALGGFIQHQLTWALISAGVACAGAWTRLR